ncbi:SDR family oxidoreductase [Pseudomonas sp. RIT-PI-S]|uniref:SDR family oxidoreductase n=1 Tax=Pseudomonas sp. RIT-PI-S TaxID=3035295 RepID=UPI0021DA75D8|nr:SDR family oxidoreductase [Pseudomonas sp. RIT-PI-S]
MRVFLTGSTGFIGSQVARELLEAGHQVLGLTRSEEGARALEAIGGEAHRGELQDLPSLQRGAAQCDGVIHTAFDHRFEHFQENCEKDRQAILALGAALEGTARPLIITSGTALGAPGPGQLAVEEHFDPHHPMPRVASELAGHDVLQRGVNLSVMRLSQIHDTHKQGLVTYLIALARQTGVSAYVGEGRNAWSAAHVNDTARLYRLALEKATPGARYHATAESAIPFHRIAEAIGQALGLPTKPLAAQDAAAHFGWLMTFVDKDLSASSAKTRQALGWNPDGPGLIEDLLNLEPR